MKCWVGVGSNLGDRRDHLQKAGLALKALARPGAFRASPLYENPAMVPTGAPLDWNKPFLNGVVELDFPGSASELFIALKKIEVEVGRTPSERWAPRVLDLDLLMFGEEIVQTAELQVPHMEMNKRSFVLDPLKDLVPDLKLPGLSETASQRARRTQGHSPLWMGILNLTPDSFSDGGELSDFFSFKQRLTDWFEAGVQILDVGAESTRPGALLVEPMNEWDRLQPALEMIRLRFQDQIFKPLVSIDTRHPEVAEKALAAGADWINDVSGLSDPAMVELAQDKKVSAIFMHSLSVPADPLVTLPRDADPVVTIKDWASRKIDELQKAGVDSSRLIMDPGIGFGKTAYQSLSILKRWDEFQDLPVRLLCGHSRKSFLQVWTKRPAADRDPESIGVSLSFIGKAVDILRVHEPVSHLRAWHSYQEVNP